MKILALIFLLSSLGEQLAFADTDKNSSHSLLLLKAETNTQKRVIKNKEKTARPQSKSSAKNSQISKKTSPRRRPLSKEYFLSKAYYKPQKSKKQLTKEFNQHLYDLKNVCRLLNLREEDLKRELKNFKVFLKTNLKDPYMTYKLKLKFKDVLSLIETENSDFLINLEAFAVSYRRLYNLSGNVEKQNYPHIWAKVIYEALECVLNQMAA